MMKRFAPDTTAEDLTAAMATTLRASCMTFGGSAEEIEDRAFNILWRNPSARGGFSYAEIKPRLAAVIQRAREFGPILLETA